MRFNDRFGIAEIASAAFITVNCYVLDARVVREERTRTRRSRADQNSLRASAITLT